MFAARDVPREGASGLEQHDRAEDGRGGIEARRRRRPLDRSARRRKSIDIGLEPLSGRLVSAIPFARAERGELWRPAVV